MTDLVRGFAIRASIGSRTGASTVAPIPAASPVTTLFLKNSEAMAHPPLLLKRIYSYCLPKFKHCHKRFILERKRIFRCLEQPELEQLLKAHDYGLKPLSLLSPTSQERQLSRERNQCSKSATRFAAATYQVQVGGPRAK